MIDKSKYPFLAAVVFVFLVSAAAAAQNPPKVVHVFVALCDNRYQGIVPVPARLGDGDDPGSNLYWGARYGVKAFLKRSPRWKWMSTTGNPIPAHSPVLERCLFRHASGNVFLIADAYQGRQIRQTVKDFLDSAAGALRAACPLPAGSLTRELPAYGGADLLIYVGHDGLMDFRLPSYPQKQDDRQREVMILACLSKLYFSEPIARSGAEPLLWTTGLMAPEAYTLESAVEGWILQESAEKIRLRAATAYNAYQRCGLNAAKRLWATGR